MTTLDEAWAWYRAAAEGARSLTHLAKFWGELPWGQENEWVARIERDSVLRHLEADRMARDANRVTDDLDDHAVLMLFSVFEAIVRDWIEAQIKPEVDSLRHPTLVKAGKDVLDSVAEGSFFRVLEPYKSSANSELVERVNQVRRHRNWVAHGRRPDKKPSALVTPKDAYDRLSEFLALVQELRQTPLAPSGDATA